jgi:[glutamine synthetase] adenylyltransferase / [glutamine synthetase]-adenylyl-L-tyrosine phosphorylase
MTISFEKIKKDCPEICDEVIDDYLRCLPDRYFLYFTEEQHLSHVKKLANISSENPVEIIVKIDEQNESAVCTVFSFDYKSVFSMIVGVLGAMGLEIGEGEVFTYQRKEEVKRQYRRGDYHPGLMDRKKRRCIVDCFSGNLVDVVSYEKWALNLYSKMKDIFLLLEENTDESILKAKEIVNMVVARRLSEINKKSPPVLYPIDLKVDNSNDAISRLKIVSNDTPFFLYSLASALSYNQVSIEHVRIKTIGKHIEDEIDLVNKFGKKIEDEKILDQLKMSVMLTKQITYYLDRSPNPYDTLSRFGELVDKVLKLPGRSPWLDFLSNPKALQDIARLLGASDFLWEDFLILQYESLLPVLKPHAQEGGLVSAENILQKLTKHLSLAKNREQKIVRLNEFKDQEIFRIDLGHILELVDIRKFSEQLTDLAEVVIVAAIDMVYEELIDCYGKPKSFAGMDTVFSVFGLGKLGGKALGYASDIELLFVYSDKGETDGGSSIRNAEFFELLVKGVIQFIRSKRGEFFQLDMRLRPYGQDGPMAVSLESFCNYYGNEGKAHIYERLAMVRLRSFGGDQELGQRIERLRDEFVYSSIAEEDIEELWKLRKKQFEEKHIYGQYNVKFSPGALVGLEYAVQLLQMIHGRKHKALRTPYIHVALLGLAEASLIDEADRDVHTDAYYFLRGLVNGLRMLRGNAKDLYIPKPDTEEYEHLARRMGYETDGDLAASERLYVDFETRTAMVRHFIEKYISREAIPAQSIVNIADLVLARDIPDDLKEDILKKKGFRDSKKAYKNLMRIIERTHNKVGFARLAVLACDWISKKSDPDRALNNWERFMTAVGIPDDYINLFLAQPVRLDILLDIFSVSQFLADSIIRYPSYFKWVTKLKYLYVEEKRGRLESDLVAISNSCIDEEEWLDKLRGFKKREILRIAIRDVSIQAPLTSIIREISLLAEVMVQIVLKRIWQDLDKEYRDIDFLQDSFCILALGKLGARELNYSSDIDLLVFYHESVLENTKYSVSEVENIYKKVMEKLKEKLSCYTLEGYAYRVDLNLRPFGKAGNLVSAYTGLLKYYEKAAGLWELQALLKVSPIAGNWWYGFSFIYEIKKIVDIRLDESLVGDNIKSLRKIAVSRDKRKLLPGIDIKNGEGGIRDIEFLVQGLQLKNLRKYPELFRGETLKALDILKDKCVLDGVVVDKLKKNYLFFRRVEHFLQILDDRQTHTVPEDAVEVEALAKRLVGNDEGVALFIDKLKADMQFNKQKFDNYL